MRISDWSSDVCSSDLRSEISCDGAGSVLRVGDVVLPEHGLSMATGYDDCFNQTPERIVASIHSLGYRGDINHYVGMSHYFRLETLGGGFFLSLAEIRRTACRERVCQYV